MKILKTLLSFALMIIYLCVGGCQKEVHQVDNPELSQKKVSAIKDKLEATHMFQRFSKKINDSLSMVWEPVWSEATVKKDDDTSSFTYVPLFAKMIKNGIEVKTKIVNFKSYLIIKNEKEYYLGDYFYELLTPLAKGEQPQLGDLRNFTGTALLQNLSNNEVYELKYKNGSRDRTTNSKTAKSAGNGDMETNGWVEQCHTETACDFYGVCEGTYYYHRNPWGCDPPPMPVGGYCEWAQWSLGNTFPVRICETVYIPDPPLPEDGGSPGSPGTPGTPGTGTGQLNDIVFNGISDPCLSAALVDATQSNRRILGTVNNIINFLDGQKNVKVNVVEGLTTNGKPADAGHMVYDLNTNQWSVTITMLQGYFVGTTREAVAATLIHEIIHAYIMYTSSPVLNNHTEMINKYVDPIALYLQNAYGLSIENAWALAYAGVQDAPSFSNANMDDQFNLGTSGLKETKENLLYNAAKYKEYEFFHLGTAYCP